MAIYYGYLDTAIDSFQYTQGMVLETSALYNFIDPLSEVRMGYVDEAPFAPDLLPPAPASVPTIVGELNTGESVSIVLYDSNMNSVTLDDDTCTEKDATGFFSWSSNNMTTFPTEATIYFWVMTDTSGRRDYGTVEIGDRPTPELGSVWDALTADHTVAGSFGERVDAIPTAAENRQEMDGNSIQLGQIRINSDRVDGLIEDDGLGNDRFTEKALEEAPGTSIGDIETGCGNALTTYDAATGADVTVVEGKVDDIYIDTQRVDGLIEDDGLGSDRFTEKALEEAPTSSGHVIAAEVWEYALTGIEGAGSAASRLLASVRTSPIPLVKEGDIFSMRVDMTEHIKSQGVLYLQGLKWRWEFRDRFGLDASSLVDTIMLDNKNAVMTFKMHGGEKHRSPYVLSVFIRKWSEPRGPWATIPFEIRVTE